MSGSPQRLDTPCAVAGRSRRPGWSSRRAPTAGRSTTTSTPRRSTARARADARSQENARASRSRRRRGRRVGERIECTRPCVSTSTPTTRRSRKSTRRTSVSGRMRRLSRARTAGVEVAARRAHALAADLVHRVRAPSRWWSGRSSRRSAGSRAPRRLRGTPLATARARSAGGGGWAWGRPASATGFARRGRSRGA